MLRIALVAFLVSLLVVPLVLGLTTCSYCAGCGGATEILVDADVADYAIFGCNQLESVTFSNNVSVIGEGAFRAATSLTQINLGKGVAVIGMSAFLLSGLTAVLIPDTVTLIAPYAFTACFNLTHVTLSSGVTTINRSSFSQTGLTSITIPSTITHIEDYAFSECYALAHVTFKHR